jgi:hypothetical protein
VSALTRVDPAFRRRLLDQIHLMSDGLYPADRSDCDVCAKRPDGTGPCGACASRYAWAQRLDAAAQTIGQAHSDGDAFAAFIGALASNAGIGAKGQQTIRVAAAFTALPSLPSATSGKAAA